MSPTLIPADGKDKIAYIMASSGEKVTYGELEAASNQAAHLFKTLGLVVGDHIALLMENNADFFKICWAAQRSGLYFTAISNQLLEKEISYITNDCNAKVLITSQLLSDVASKALSGVPNDCHLYMTGGTIDGFLAWEEAIDPMPITPIENQMEGVEMLYSSGTTGQPKGIKRDLTNQTFGEPNIMFDLLAQMYQITDESVYLSPAPCYHAAAMRFNLVVMRKGGTCIIMEKFDAEQAIALIDKHKVTITQWVPTMFIRLLKLPEEIRFKYDYSSLKLVIHAAAPCPIDVKRQMIDWWGPIIFEYYSGTEGTGFTGLDSKEWLAHPGSVGKALLGVVRIIDENNNLLPAGEIGSIYFESDLSFEYHNSPEKTQGAFNPEGWSTLGDIGYLDNDGYLYLTDRKAFTIISGGVNIYPQEIENLLVTHPKVMDVAVIGVPNEEFGESVKAIVQPISMNDANDVFADELTQFCKANLSSVKCPKSIVFDPELPRQPTGKLFKRLLKDKYGAA